MPDSPIEPREHYVYALYREDGTTPFYIGMGKGRRWLAHDRPNVSDKSPKSNTVRKVKRLLGHIPKAKLAEGLTSVEAFVLEATLIAKWGRIPLGPLTNFTAGGDGVTGHPPESRAKQSEANRRAWADPVKRAARLAAIAASKAAWSPEKREEIRLANVAQQQAIRAQHSKARTTYWLAQNGGPPKGRAQDNRRQWMLDQWQNPETRKVLEAGRDGAVQAARSAKAIEKRRAAAHAYWSDPENIARRSRPKEPKEPYDSDRRSAALRKMWAGKRESILEKRRISKQSHTTTSRSRMDRKNSRSDSRPNPE